MLVLMRGLLSKRLVNDQIGLLNPDYDPNTACQ